MEIISVIPVGTLEKTCKAVNCLIDLLPETDFNNQPNVTN